MCSLIESVTVDVWMANADNHMKLVEDNLDKIPEIGVIPPHSLKHGQLVRFRGMVQDMADPVLYLHKYEVINNKTGSKDIRCGKYKDTLNIEDDEVVDEESPNYEHSERRSIYCVSVPGLNSWTKPATPSDFYQTSKSMVIEESSSSTLQSKRNADDMEQDEDPSTTISEANKRQQKGTGKNDEHVDILLNHPIEGTCNYSCLINVYEEIDESLVKMNSVVDVVGFVSFTSDCDEFNHLPATLVPRLHAVSLKRISHSNPFHPPSLDQSVILSKAEKIRSDLMCALSQMLLGDKLAAEYILCNLISRIYHRNEVLTLGNCSINLTKVPANNYPEEIYNILKNLLPKSHYIPMTLEKMNSNKFLPEKDYEHNCLKSGILQLSDHTHLFIDETKMETGQLNANGVLNLKALNELVTDQKIDYDFKYVKIEIPIDVPTIILSEGKSLLSANAQVILTPEANHGSFEECLTAAKEILSKEPLLTEIRQYLTLISHVEFNLADDLIETIQQDYVKLRQEERRVNESDLHLLLILARLVSLSYGQVSLTKEMWEKAFEMELFRKERINNREP